MLDFVEELWSFQSLRFCYIHFFGLGLPLVLYGLEKPINVYVILFFKSHPHHQNLYISTDVYGGIGLNVSASRARSEMGIPNLVTF